MGMYDYDRRKVAMEHATPEAKKKYLRDHPDADPKNHTVAKPKRKPKRDYSNEKGHAADGSSRKHETAKLLKTHGEKPGLEHKIVQLEDDAEELDKLEKDYAKLPADENYSMQRKVEQAFDDYSKKLEYVTGVKPKKPWYYDR